MTSLFRHSVPFIPVFLIALVNVNVVLGDSVNCSYATVGKPRHYFDDYTEVTYNASCGHVCSLPVSQDTLLVTELKVYFPHNHTDVSCSWVLPGFQNNKLSIVMFFEPIKLASLSHEILCGQSAPSLTLWDEYSSGGEVQTTYSICRKPGDNSPEAYSRKSSKLGHHDTLLTLKDYQAQPRENPVLLKYITVNWSRDCSDDYRDIAVGPAESTTSLGSQWFTTNLRLPNGMHCKWKFSSAAALSSDMIRLRVNVLKRTPTSGSCAEDDYVQLKNSTQTERFNLCDNSTPFFFFSFTSSIYVDFYSGGVGGAPEFEMTYSNLTSCPGERLLVETDLVENVVYGVSDPQLTSDPCGWKLNTNWTNNVIMLTRFDRQQFQQGCTNEDYLEVDLGTGGIRRISLCEDPPLPLWSYGHSVTLTLNHKPGSSRRTLGVFYKSVPRVPYCQKHPGLLVATSSKPGFIFVESTSHVQHRDVSAPDCRWQITPSPDLKDPDRYVVRVLVSDSGADSDFWESNSTTAAWMISGFRAYSGTSFNATVGLSHSCYYVKTAVECQFLSSSLSLLLVYDPSLSTSPVPLNRVSITYQEVVKKDTSGQPGSVMMRSWHAHSLLLLVATVFWKLLC